MAFSAIMVPRGPIVQSGISGSLSALSAGESAQRGDSSPAMPLRRRDSSSQGVILLGWRRMSPDLAGISVGEIDRFLRIASSLIADGRLLVVSDVRGGDVSAPAVKILRLGSPALTLGGVASLLLGALRVPTVFTGDGNPNRPNRIPYSFKYYSQGRRRAY